MKYGMADELLPATSEGGRAVEAFIKICPPVDRANLDCEWMEMCGLFVKGWLAKAAEQRLHLTAIAACGLGVLIGLGIGWFWFGA